MFCDNYFDRLESSNGICFASQLPTCAKELPLPQVCLYSAHCEPNILSWQAAQECERRGARLCHLDELMNSNASVPSGCMFADRMQWSGTVCGVDSYWAVLPPKSAACRPVDRIGQTMVQCCADEGLPRSALLRMELPYREVAGLWLPKHAVMPVEVFRHRGVLTIRSGGERSFGECQLTLAGECENLQYQGSTGVMVSPSRIEWSDGEWWTRSYSGCWINMPDCVARRVWKKIKLAGAVFKHWLPDTASSEHICLAQVNAITTCCLPVLI